MKKSMICSIIALSISGCANQAQFIAGQQALVDTAQKVADEVMVTSIFNICNVVTVGAWTRYFGTDKAKADAWKTICAPTVTQTPAK